MKYCIFMPTTFIIDKNSHLFKSNQLEKTEKRLKQYKQGIDKLVELNKNYKLDIYIADNGDNFNDKIKIPECIKVIKNNPNKLGRFNKGSGIIEIWNNNIEILKQYDYIIHFEPRQLLIDNSFIDNFMINPRSLFTYSKNPNAKRHFNTGLFICKSMDLINFITVVTPEILFKNSLSIEYILHDFYNNFKINYSVLDKMNLIWYDTYANKEKIN